MCQIPSHLSRVDYRLYRSGMQQPPFKYVGGDPSLDLVNTVDWTDAGLVHERLPDYGALTRWAEGAGVVTPAVAQRLRRQAAERPREAAAALDAARQLRD